MNSHGVPRRSQVYLQTEFSNQLPLSSSLVDAWPTPSSSSSIRSTSLIIPDCSDVRLLCVYSISSRIPPDAKAECVHRIPTYTNLPLTCACKNEWIEGGKRREGVGREAFACLAQPQRGARRAPRGAPRALPLTCVFKIGGGMGGRALRSFGLLL